VNGPKTQVESARKTAVRAALALSAAALAVWLLAACSGTPWKEGQPNARLGENCVRASTKGPLKRVTNYADPELCGRIVAHRSPYHVRTKPMPEAVATAAVQGR
jgi:hypothetical protein